MTHVSVQETVVPAIGLGTWPLKGPACREAVATAIELGYRHIDTAQMYANEREVGQGIAASGVNEADLFVVTKIWKGDTTRQRVREKTLLSRDLLGIKQINLLLIHWPDPQTPLRETLEAMAELQNEGVVRYLGVSNFDASLLAAAQSITPILCNQVEMHPYQQQKELVAAAEKRSIAITAYSPLARGKVADDALLTQIGKDHGKTPSQVALRWLVQHDHVMAIPKASSRAHLQENIDVFDFTLSPEEMRRVEKR